MRRASGTLLALALGASCGSPPRVDPGRPIVAGPTEETPCDAAKRERLRVPGLASEGKLDRTARVLERAEALCPKDANLGWADRLSTLVELGRWSDIRALATQVRESSASDDALRAAATAALDAAAAGEVAMEATDDAKAPMRAAYRDAAARDAAGDARGALDGYLRAWELWHPNGQALIQAGLAARTLGDRPRAQRLFDRGIVELERASGARLSLDVPNGFEGPVTGVAWSARGRIAVSHGEHITVFAQSSLREVQRIESPFGRLRSVAFSVDGTRVAAGGLEDKVGTWDASTGEPIGMLPDAQPHGRCEFGCMTNAIGAIAFTGEGTSYGSPDVTASVPSASGRRSLEAPIEGVLAFAISASGKRFAFGANGAAVVVDVSSGNEVLRAEGVGRVSAMAFTPDEAQLVVASGASIQRWSLSKKAKLDELRARGVGAVAVSPDGAWLATNGSDLQIWSLASGASQRSTKGLAGARFATFSPDGARLAIANGSRVEVRDVATLETLRSVGDHAGPVWGAAFSPSFDALVAGSESDATLFPLVASKGWASLDSDEPFVSFAFDAPDPGTLTTSSFGGEVRVWDRTTTERRPAPWSTELRAPFAISRGGAWIAARDGAEALSLVSVRGATARILAPAVRDSDSVAFAPDDHVVAFTAGESGAETDVITVASVDEAGAVRRVDGRASRAIRDLCFSADGAVLYWGGDVQLRGLELSTSAVHDATKGTSLIETIACSPSRSIVATGGYGGEVRVVDADGKQLARFDADTELVNDVAYSRDGRWLVAGTFDGSAILARDPTYAVVATLRRVRDARAGYAFTPDGFVEFFGPDAAGQRGLPLCRVGSQSFDFDVCSERFEVNGLLTKLAGDDASYRLP